MGMCACARVFVLAGQRSDECGPAQIAIESVYPCLGISCADVNAMVDPATTALLWQPCGATTGPASLAPGSRSGAAANAASFAAVAAIAVAAFA